MHLQNDLPPCLCGAHDINPGGGSFGSSVVSYAACVACGRQSVLLMSLGFRIALWERDVERPQSPTYFPRLDEWAVKVFWPACRAWNQDKERGIADIVLDPYPPQIPEDFPAVVFWGPPEAKSSWERVDLDRSRATPAPPDPIVTQNRLILTGVFADVAEKLGRPPFEVDVVPNEYGGVEEWFRLKIGETDRIVVGRRKRVWSVHGVWREARNASSIFALGKRDSATHGALGTQESVSVESAASALRFTPETRAALMLVLQEKYPDGKVPLYGEVPEGRPANEVYIHAWDREKLVEYLMAMVRL